MTMNFIIIVISTFLTAYFKGNANAIPYPYLGESSSKAFWMVGFGLVSS